MSRSIVDCDESEASLLRRYAQSREQHVRERLVMRFMPLAHSLALRYRGTASEPFEDLVQVANFGLLKAIDGFDPLRGRPFAAYAVPTILGELRRHFRDRVGNLRLPRRLQERAAEVNAAIQELTDENGGSPTVEQIAEHLELSDEDVLEALEAGEARRTLSLDAPVAGDDEAQTAVLDSVGTIEPGYEVVETQLGAAGARLEPREHEILRLRFGNAMTQAEIGRRLGVSQMHVSRVMRRSLGKLLTAVQAEA